MTTRTQLSLFVPGPFRVPLEAVRRLLDPIQHALIPAHVTLCREDEIGSLDPDELRSRLTTAGATPITLRFGRPEPFQGHGALLPCVAGGPAFHALRRIVLGSDMIRRPGPHITLAHPRNPKAPTNVPENADRLSGELAITFTSVRLIEQTDSQPWHVLEKFTLSGDPLSDG